jgi:hypothetical protein
MTKPDPNYSELKVAAVAVHEVFLTLQSAGFTEQQALQIVTGMAAAKVGGDDS